ncbi:MAG: DivIVA domain-containing protein [Clostridia bacterium]|nr:DivIVA domain-containing protein [Clostridia bacterium]
MSGEKKFGTSAIGFNKSDVNAYIEKIIHEFDQRLKEKDDEISNLKLQIREMKSRYDSASQDNLNLSKEKERIASALIQAQEKADAIMAEAKARAEAEKARLEQTLESEREKIIDIKRDVKAMKNQVVDMLSKYQSLLNDVDTYIESRETEYTERSGDEA